MQPPGHREQGGKHRRVDGHEQQQGDHQEEARRERRHTGQEIEDEVGEGADVEGTGDRLLGGGTDPESLELRRQLGHLRLRFIGIRGQQGGELAQGGQDGEAETEQQHVDQARDCSRTAAQAGQPWRRAHAWAGCTAMVSTRARNTGPIVPAPARSPAITRTPGRQGDQDDGDAGHNGAIETVWSRHTIALHESRHDLTRAG